MSCHTVLGRLSLILIYCGIITLNSALKTASSSSVKTNLGTGKTFAGSPVNACSVEPESVLNN